MAEMAGFAQTSRTTGGVLQCPPRYHHERLRSLSTVKPTSFTVCQRKSVMPKISEFGAVVFH
jgi:hypothetical protein